MRNVQVVLGRQQKKVVSVLVDQSYIIKLYFNVDLTTNLNRMVNSVYLTSGFILL